MSTQNPPGIWQTCNHSKKSGGAHRTSRSQAQSLPAESASKSRWAFRSAGMSVGGSFGGELTFACLEPRPARPRRKLEAECSRCGTYKRGGMLRQARFEFVRGQRRRTGVQGKPGPESVDRRRFWPLLCIHRRRKSLLRASERATTRPQLETC